MNIDKVLLHTVEWADALLAWNLGVSFLGRLLMRASFCFQGVKTSPLVDAWCCMVLSLGKYYFAQSIFHSLGSLLG